MTIFGGFSVFVLPIFLRNIMYFRLSPLPHVVFLCHSIEACKAVRLYLPFGAHPFLIRAYPLDANRHEKGKVEKGRGVDR